MTCLARTVDMKTLLLLISLLLFVCIQTKKANSWKDYRKEFEINKLVSMIKSTVNHDNQTTETSPNSTLNDCPKTEPAIKWVSFVEGVVVLVILQITFFVPIIEHGTRSLLVFIGLLCSLYLNKSTFQDKEMYHPINMFFHAIFVFTVCVFLEFLVAFVSVERIRKEMEKKRKIFKGFVEPNQKSTQKDDKVKALKKTKKSLTRTDPGLDVKPEVKVPEDLEDKEVTPAVVKMPEPQDDTSKNANIVVRDPKQVLGPPIQTDKPGPKAVASIPSPTDMAKHSSGKKSEESSESEILLEDPVGQTSLPIDLIDLKEERKQKRNEKKLREINNKLHLMYSVSHLPADIMARTVFPVSFTLFAFYFWIVYVM